MTLIKQTGCFYLFDSHGMANANGTAVVIF